MPKRKQDDGYDPDAKGEQDGKEHRARFEVRETVMAEPLTEPTRKTRRSLLALSVLALVVNARLPIEKLPYIGTSPSDESLAAVLGIISIGIVYFMLNFVVSAGNEYLRWRLEGHLTLLRQTHDWLQGINEHSRRVAMQLGEDEANQTSENLAKVAQEASVAIPDLSRRFKRTENYYVSTTRVQMNRVLLLELALPLLVAALALWKVAAFSAPMIARIVTA